MGLGTRQGFPQRARLLRSGDFRRVYSRGRRRSVSLLVAFFLPNGKPWSRIGLTVPRALGGAVERNFLKRRFREASRKHLQELGPGWDVVFNPRSSAKTVPFEQLEEAVRQIFANCAREAQRSCGDGPPGGSVP